MTRLLPASLICVLLLVSSDSQACSPPYFEFGPPSQDLGYDPAESPGDPVISEAYPARLTFRDRSTSGCGRVQESSCHGTSHERLELLAQPADDIDRVEVDYGDGVVTYAEFGDPVDGVVTILAETQYLEPFLQEIPPEIRVTYIDSDGYRSNTVVVPVGPVQSRTIRALTAQAPRGVWALALVLGLVPVSMRRRRA